MNTKSEILQLYKQPGETPLESIYRFKEDHPEYKDIKMTYVGRLDPMAEGVLLVLAGDTRNKKQYLDLDKVYEFEVLWGFETDTHDALGIVRHTGQIPLDLEKKMPGLLKKIADKKTQSYPSYSSRTVLGRPLFLWARENRIEEIDVPVKNIKIFSIEHGDTRLISQEEIVNDAIRRISEVKGDFRQKEIIESWNAAIEPREQALISSFRAHVSTGTYIRGLAHEMGQMIGSGALAWSIKRTKIGEYSAY